MTVIALAIWFTLYALTTLCHAAIPEWVLGISALIVVIVLFLGGAWRAKGNSALTLILACSLLLLAGCSTTNVSEVIKAADTAHKRIHVEMDGWNAHFRYDSWPSSPTNSNALP